MNKQEIIDELTRKSKIFLRMIPIDHPPNPRYGVEFGLKMDMDLLQEACLEFRKNLPKGIDLFMSGGRAAFEVDHKILGRVNSIVYLVNI